MAARRWALPAEKQKRLIHHTMNSENKNCFKMFQLKNHPHSGQLSIIPQTE